jgi:polar amino acid transport system substrate-binding protein
MKSFFNQAMGAQRRLLLSAVMAAGLFTAGVSQAQSVASIKKEGVLKVGSQVAQIPWGFTDATGTLTGYDIELVNLLAKDLGVKVAVTPVTPPNRVAALLTGQVDVLAAVMGIFPDRQKVVLFSRPYANIDNVFIGKTGTQIKGWADLKNMRVGVPRGTPMDLALTKANPPGTTIQRFDDDSTTVQALLGGQVDVMGGNMTQAVNIAKVAGPGKFETKFILSRGYNAFAVRPGEREWVDYLNGFLARKIASGELAALYKKWIGADLTELPTTGEGETPLAVILAK